VAILYRAQLTPTKMELLSLWAPLQPWYASSGPPTLEAIGAYRFDDPDGEVGIETHLLRSTDGQVLQVPLTYRGDAVYAQALATAILTGGTQAELEVVTDEGFEVREATTKVAGSGLPGSTVPHVGTVTVWTEGDDTHISCGGLELTVLRTINAAARANPPGTSVLVGTWPGQATPLHLASARGN
jgi:hypothetical protein